ncbi:PHP domain protein [groundwater metagenome]|uniref:PHP domain protein n=1 Tax=groundwater metagenome TaxID=717931 RepID=A0A098E761_9ZZZZ
MILADFHLHSKYSRATSPLMDVIGLGKAAKEKGINLLGTGDFTHPMYFAELKKNLTKFNEGIFIEEKSGTKFILTTEICLIFSKEINKVKKVRKIHLLVFAKNFEIAEQINDWLSGVGNLKADGRPIFGMNAVDFTEKMLKISGENFIVPAHLWTPWFGILGSKSGFDSIEECFEDQSRHIHAIETGLSSDPAMNWRVSELDKYALISNSDSHSLHNLGRECNAFNFDEEKVNYQDIINAIKFKDKNKFLFTLEVPPEFGKYHYTGHRNCNFSCTPEESINLHNICPVCNNPLTIGVEQRVEELADRKSGFIPKDAIPFKNIIPLWEICEKFKVKDKEKILLGKFDNEMNVLLNAEIDEIDRIDENIANVIESLRNNKYIVKPGYDGVYGEILTEGGNKSQGCKEKDKEKDNKGKEKDNKGKEKDNKGKEKDNKGKEKEKSKGKERQKGLDEFL